ncbi:MAG TPA: hypothetical protein VFR70_07935 [Flavobacterium sp.]|nr:hypothetical protein [Flavobacterium sp.]
MRNFTFLLAGFFLFGTAADASEKSAFAEAENYPAGFSDAEPITFIERGIEFYIFPDGQFDFNTEPSYGEAYYRNGRRGANVTYGAPATANFSGVRVEHDSQGRIRRIGNVFVNYDAQNRIKRIGSVYMAYNSFALARVGNLQIIYNRRGEIVDVIGSVKGYGGINYTAAYYTPASYPNNSQYYYKNGSTDRNEKSSN